jgi:hypothetical protein
MLITAGATDQSRNAGKQSPHVVHQHVQHPGPSDHQYQHHHQQLGDERQCHLVNLGCRLKETHQQASNQRRAQHRCRHHDGDFQRLLGNVQHRFWCHHM